MTKYNHKFKNVFDACGIEEERQEDIRKFIETLSTKLHNATCNSEEVEIFEKELFNNQSFTNSEKALIIVILSNAIHRNSMESTLRGLAESMAEGLMGSAKGKRSPIGFNPMGGETAGNC